jgi:hypothetical protein
VDVSASSIDDSPVKNNPLVLLPDELALLRRIAEGPLPFTLSGDDNLIAVSTLLHAGHVKTTMRLVLDPLGELPQVGVVVSQISRSGWRMPARG